MEKREQKKELLIIPEEDLKQIIEKSNAQKLVEWAKKLGERLKENEVATHQIRRIFSEVRRIEMEWQKPEQRETAMRLLIMLKPRLYWQAKRVKKMEELQRNLDPAIDMIKGNWNNFRNFVNFFEAILAYHGGGD